ncbi:MAG TPA: GNAT family N-acetyltransferase, partial [Acidimicrobiales bacterium]|nr:GNAT family N-acetyltransferase [Acidimicrobiales bacterium]
MADAGYRITVQDGAKLSDEEIALDNLLFNTLELELWPQDPVTPEADAIAEHRAVPARVQQTAVRVWAPDGSLAGSLDLGIDPEKTDNPDVLGFGMTVHHAHRRRGIATGLLAHVVAFARANERDRLVFSTRAPVPAGARFAASLGAVAKSMSHTNHLPTAEVDRELMEAWVAEGPMRAEGYELLTWDGAVPEEHLGDFVDLMLVMNDAPRDDLEVNDFTLTPAEWREAEARSDAVGCERWMLVARRIKDGALGGFHRMAWVPALPNAVFVADTGVRPEHRGRALGKWLKAAMTLRVLDERPDVTDIRTDNADSNDAMLGINEQMGYRQLLGATTWEMS